MCSLIVHLHLNRFLRFLILPHPNQPVNEKQTIAVSLYMHRIHPQNCH